MARILVIGSRSESIEKQKNAPAGESTSQRPKHNGVEIVEPTEVPEAPAHGTGRLVLAACRRYLAAHGCAPERKQEFSPLSFDGRVPRGFGTINPK